MNENSIISNYKFYSFFTKYSLMENYGFIPGILGRISRKLIPKVTTEDTIEFYLKNKLKNENYQCVIEPIQELLSQSNTKQNIFEDLNSAILALSSKIVSYGFDHEFQTIFSTLNIDSKCFKELLYQASALSEGGIVSFSKFHQSLDQISHTIHLLRQSKNHIGTSLHLTVETKNLLNYIERIKTLLDLKSNINDKKKWENLIADYQSHVKSINSLRKFVRAHTDLLILEIVEHTAQKGEKYVADNSKEYVMFFKKGLLGGLLISIFAFYKIIFDASVSSPLPLAFLYSVNYALCFVIVFMLGGTIATKQPAMTASAIAKHIDKHGDLKIGCLKEIVMLLRKISRSQFISLLGNFIMAFSVSCLIAYLMTLFFNINPITEKKSILLVEQSFPFSGGAIFYAAVAGFFLSLSGFISGYFDNKVKAANLAYRIEHHKTFLKVLSQTSLQNLSKRIERNLGSYAGNISLGFFLGSAFLLSYILPFNVDIRHIAFSSSNLGYGIISHDFSFSTILFALASVLLIGFINFFVSFSLTFLLVLKSRGMKISNLGQLIWLSFKDILFNPLQYIIVRNKKESEQNYRDIRCK